MRNKFKYISLSIIAIAFFTSGKLTCTVDKEEAKAAYEYLNKVRQSPKEYSKEIGWFMKRIDSMPALVWNDTLAEVAEARAMDMAEKKYFGHVNKKGQGVNILIYKAGYELNEVLYKKKKMNSFESIAMGMATGEETVKALIIDKGINPPNHRKHLLGMTDFWANCYDCGIGFVRTDDPVRPTYVCIIIAKHDL